MTPEDYGIIRLLAYYYSQGLTDEEVIERAMARLVGIPEQRLIELADPAFLSLEVAERFRTANRSTELYDLLEGETPPNSQVSVSLLYEYVMPNGQRRQNTVKVMVDWTTTIGDVLEQGQALIEDITRDYGTLDIAFSGVVGGIYAPSDEQL